MTIFFKAYNDNIASYQKPTASSKRKGTEINLCLFR